MTRKKAAIMGSAVAALLVLGGVAAAAIVLVTGGRELPYETQAQLQKAMPSMAAAELETRGVTLAGPLECEETPGASKQRLRVSCTGTTADKKPVEVLGSGQLETQDSFYTILVDGKPVVENAACIGKDCEKDE
ncbi:hypothetical protein [Actinomadura sp. WMMB 499]|uniref:hypothetical protein n=1 Tax=Actinomadura sp. WMMB 499 TaxID=1219491 RepID=UPI0020C77759|nr:hypothetical protein [Actinomadura sp. WMMB 499]